MSKQDQVVEMVKAGQSTRKEILEAVGCTSGALASYLSGMRNAAKYSGVALCPITDENGIFSVTTFEEAERLAAARTATGGRASKVSPAKRLENAQKRLTRCEGAVEKAVNRADENEDDRELQLRADKAKIEVELAEIELKKAQELYDATPEDQRGDEAEVEETTADAPEDADDFPEDEDFSEDENEDALL